MIRCLTRFGISNGSFRTQLTCSFSQLSFLVGSNFFFLALLQGMWNLSFPTRNQTVTPCRVLTTGPPGKSCSDFEEILSEQLQSCARQKRAWVSWKNSYWLVLVPTLLLPEAVTLAKEVRLGLVLIPAAPGSGERCSEDPADQKSPLSAVGDHLWMSTGHLGSCESLWGRADTDHALCALPVGRTHLTVR